MHKNRMKVAVINNTAQFGSTGKLAYCMYKMLNEKGHTARLYYGRCDDIQKEDIIKITTSLEVNLHVAAARASGLHGYYSNRATRDLCRQLDEFRPDIVHLFNLHGYYININRLLNYLKTNGIATVYTMIDEFPYLGRCCYAYDCDKFHCGCKDCSIDRRDYPATFFFRNAKKYHRDKARIYTGFRNIVFTAPGWVAERASQSSLLSKMKVEVIDEFVDTDKTFFPKKEYVKIDPRLLDHRKIIVLDVAPYSNIRKGGSIFLDLAKRMELYKEYIFVYIGMDKKNVSIPPNCISIGYIKDQDELAEYYSAADVYLCTSLADTMPNACIDAIACGTPVIGFNTTGIPYIAEEPIGTFVPKGDMYKLEEKLLEVRKKDEGIINFCRSYALTRYAPEIFYNKMMCVYRLLQDGKDE